MVDVDQFERWITDVRKDLPDPVQRVLERHGIDIVIKESPDARLRREVGEEVFGVFTGRPLDQQKAPGTVGEPTRIELYTGTFERHCSDPRQMKRQIQKTVIHEVGHFLGMDEQQLKKYGY